MPSDSLSFLRSGERARLIPVVADTSQEARIVSILLATISGVRPFARTLLESIGKHVGTHTRIDAYTEVVFRKNPQDVRIRPDGILVLTHGKRTWSALIEAKIGRSNLTADQVLAYCELARLNGVDAVVTISNEFVAIPSHHPLDLPRKATNRLDLFHWSWMHVRTQAILALSDVDFASPEQKFLLEEMIRHFEHEKSGISSFDRMNREWKELVTKVQTGTPLTRSAVEVENSVAAWHQEQKDLCLLISRKLGRRVSLKLARTYSSDEAR